MSQLFIHLGFLLWWILLFLKWKNIFDTQYPSGTFKKVCDFATFTLVISWLLNDLGNVLKDIVDLF